jgi:hypothetical protein
VLCAEKPHDTFCGSRWRVTAAADPVGCRVTGTPTATVIEFHDER